MKTPGVERMAEAVPGPDPVHERKAGALGLLGRTALAAVVVLAAGTAGAQYQTPSDEYTISGPVAFEYQPLSVMKLSPPSTFNQNIDWDTYSTNVGVFRVQLPSDFVFRYWGQEYSALHIGGNGGIIPVIGAPSFASANDLRGYNTYTFGYSNSYSKGRIAPWMDDWARGSQSPHPGGVFYEIVGEAPNRVFKVEWQNVNSYACGTSSARPSSYVWSNCAEQRSYSFQAWLFEVPPGETQNSTIIFSYGTPIGPPPLNEPFGGRADGFNYTGSIVNYNYYHPNGAVGLENPTDYTQFFVPDAFADCAVYPVNADYQYYTYCDVDEDWPAEQAYVFSNKADPSVVAVRAPDVAWGGYHLSYSADVANHGGKDAPELRVQFFGSVDPVLSEDDVNLFYSNESAPIRRDQVVTFTGSGTLPADLVPGQSYYIIAKVDPDGAVDEDVLINNIRASSPITIGEYTPDLIVESVEPPASAPVGTAFELPWVVRNLGNLAVEDVSYVVVLSDNDVITPSDLPLSRGTFSVGALTTADVVAQVTLPDDVLAGDLYLGVIIDPDQEVYELNEFNNIGVSDQPFTAEAPGLDIVNTKLPPGEVGSPYSALLRATGGDGTYSWTVASGALPPGLELVETVQGDRVIATEIAGTPSAVVTADVGLRVESAGLSDTGTFVIEVRPANQELTITSISLPEATVMRDYEGALTAIGGTSPYTWTLEEGELPDGLGLGRDGLFFGRAREEGVYSLTVQVTDNNGASEKASFELVVLPAESIRCLTTMLPSRDLDQDYNVTLRASGGVPPYTWSTIESRRVPTDLDEGHTWAGGAPPGMFLSEAGTVNGTPTHAGSYVWQVNVQDSESTRTARCTITFEVGYDQGMTITTTTLAPAVAGERYQVELRVVGGEEPVRWSLASGSVLPQGFELATDGTLSGAFEAALLQGEPSSSHNLIVRARDHRNRIVEAPLHLQLLRDKPTWDPPKVGDPVTTGGCQTGSGAGGFLAALAVIGLATLRRRS